MIIIFGFTFAFYHKKLLNKEPIDPVDDGWIVESGDVTYFENFNGVLWNAFGDFKVTDTFES